MEGIPFFGNILQFMKQPRDYFIDCHKHYGPVFRVNTPLGFVTIICGRMAKELINDETGNGLTRKGLFKAFSTEVGVDIFEDADKDHEDSREFVKLPYSRYITAQFVPEIGQVVESFTKHLYQGQQIEFFEFCTEVTLNSVMATATPINLRDLNESFFPYADRVMDIITQKYPHFTSKFPIYKKNKLAVHERIDEVIHRHLSGEFNDLSKMYVVDAVLKNLKDSPSADELKSVRGVLIYLLAGSVVYTARLIFFYMFEVLKNRSLMDKIQDEIQMAFGDGPIDSRLFRRMPYLRSTFLEVLRMFPLLPGLPFQTTREVQVGDFTLPKREKIIFVPHSEHFVESNFQDPYHFHAERFHPRHRGRFKADTFFPYGISKRMCAARGAMEVFTLTIVVHLLRARDWSLLSPAQNYELKLNPLIGPDRPIKVIHKGKIKDRKLVSKIHTLSEVIDFESPFEEKEIEKTLPSGIHVSYKRGDMIIKQGEEPDAFYILSQGKVDVIKNSKKVAELKEGDSFGEIGLLKNMRRTASIKAKTEVHVIKISQDDFTRLVIDLDVEGEELSTKLQKYFLELNIKNSLPHLSKKLLKEMLSDYQLKNFSKGDLIIREGELSNSFYVILIGKVNVFSGKKDKKKDLAKLSQGEIFGELGIINESPRSASVEPINDVTVIEIERSHLLDLMKDSKDVQEDVHSIIFKRLQANIKKKGS